MGVDPRTGRARAGGAHRPGWSTVERHADDHSPARLRNLFVDVAIGDWVVPSDDGERIDHIIQRTSAFVRRASFEGDRFEPDALAANIDVVFLVHALGSPPNQRRLERELVLAFRFRCRTGRVAHEGRHGRRSRADSGGTRRGSRWACPSCWPVASPASVWNRSATTRGNRTLALLGASGVGKSTLVNALLDDQVMHTAAVREGDQARSPHHGDGPALAVAG